MPPPGGSPDLTAPFVVSTAPADQETGVEPDAHIRIAFSKAMDRASVERAVFFSPQPARVPLFRWDGRAVEIRPADGLLSNRTYVVTVGQAAADSWGNRMASSHSFGFSTGFHLYRGEISGRVVPMTTGNAQVFVWAYDLQSGGADPVLDRPAYVTQPDPAGHFVLPRLGPGTYRLFAFLDKTGDQSYVPSRDALAVPPGDVPVATEEDRIRVGDLQLAVRDTLPPSLEAVRTPDRHHVLLRFDEPVRLVDQPVIKGLEVRAVYQDPTDSSRVGLLTAPQMKGARYALRMVVADFAGNRATLQETVRGDGREDSRSPGVLDFSLPRHDTAPIEIAFSKAMQFAAPRNFWMATDTTCAPEGHFSWAAPNRLVFFPSGPWPREKEIRLLGPAEELQDAAGNALGESLFLSFQILDPGRVTGFSSPSPYPLVVQATDLRDGILRYEARVVPGDSAFAIEDVLPGLYSIGGFLDRSGTGRWFPGSPVPFIPADPLVMNADTIEVRARWETVLEHRLDAPVWFRTPVVEEEPQP